MNDVMLSSAIKQFESKLEKIQREIFDTLLLDEIYNCRVLTYRDYGFAIGDKEDLILFDRNYSRIVYWWLRSETPLTMEWFWLYSTINKLKTGKMTVSDAILEKLRR